jgi:hypothetical protein
MSKQSGVTGKTPMAGTQKTIAMFGSAAVLAFQRPPAPGLRDEHRAI